MKALVGLSLVAGVVVSGYMGRTAWCTLPLTALFIVAYLFGKWELWSGGWTSKSAPEMARLLLITAFSQFCVVGFLYLFGRGVGSLMGRGVVTSGLTGFDAGLVACLFLGVLMFGRPSFVQEAKANNMVSSSSWLLAVDPAPLTVETFYEPDDSAGNVSKKETIEETEARLGVVLPPLLKALYAKQNGGYVNHLRVPRVPNPRAHWDDWVHAFPDVLVSHEKLRTVYDDYLLFSEPDDEAIPPHAKQYIILSQYHMETTFLDYSQGGEPRVGIVDFERGLDDPKNLWFDSFDAFFAALRRCSEVN